MYQYCHVLRYDDDDDADKLSLRNGFSTIWVFFHGYSRFTGQQGNGEAVSLIPLYRFHPPYRLGHWLDDCCGGLISAHG